MIFDFRKISTPLTAIMLILLAVIGWKIAGDIVKPVWCMIASCEPSGWEEQEKRKELEVILVDNEKTHREEVANKEDNHNAVVEKMEYDKAVEDMVDSITGSSQTKNTKLLTASEPKLEISKPKPKPVSQPVKPKVQEPDLVAEKMAKDLWDLYLF